MHDPYMITTVGIRVKHCLQGASADQIYEYEHTKKEYLKFCNPLEGKVQHRDFFPRCRPKQKILEIARSHAKERKNLL
jgi:hypothetical protein